MQPTREELERWDRDHVWHPFTPMQAYAAERPLIIARARRGTDLCGWSWLGYDAGGDTHMNIELTEEQRQAVSNGEAVHLPVPEIGGTVVVLRAEQYERLRELLEEEEDRKMQEAWLKASHESAVSWMKENPY